MNEPIKLSDLLDLKGGTSSIEEILNALIALEEEFKNFSNTIKDVPIAQMQARQDDLIRTLGILGQQANSTNQATEQGSKELSAMLPIVRSLVSEIETLINSKRNLGKSLLELKGETSQTSKEIQKLAGDMKKMRDEGREDTDGYRKKADAIERQMKALESLKKLMQEHRKEIKANQGYYDLLKESLGELEKQYDSLSKEEVKGSKIEKELREEIKKTKTILDEKEKSLKASYTAQSAMNDIISKNIALQSKLDAVLSQENRTLTENKILLKQIQDELNLESNPEKRIALMLKEQDARAKLLDSEEKAIKKEIELFDAKMSKVTASREKEELRAIHAAEMQERREMLAIQKVVDSEEKAQQKKEAITQKQMIDGEKRAMEMNALRMKQEAVGAARAKELDRLYKSEDGSLNKLKQNLRDLTEQWHSMGAAARGANQHIKADIIKATDEVQKLERELDVVKKKETQDPSGVADFAEQLKNFAIAYVSIQTIVTGIKSAFSVALKFDAIEESLNAISKSEDEFNFNFEFTQKLANKLGLEFENLLGRFKDFSVALQGTNLEGQRTRDIFSSVAKAATVMKLPTESVKGVFLALEQIASKGTVSMEELRRQLGNRLPGAFNLFAEGLNMSTAELNKFVKEGRLTKDALVPFAEQLEKKFGGSIDEVANSLPAQMARINNAVKSLFQTDGAIGFFKFFVDAGQKFVSFITDRLRPASDVAAEAFKIQDDAFINQSNALGPLIETYDTLSGRTDLNIEEQKQLQIAINGVSNILPGVTEGVDQYGNALDINREKVSKFMIAQGEMGKMLQKTALIGLNKNIASDIGSMKAIKAGLTPGVNKAAPSNIVDFFKGFSSKDSKMMSAGGGIPVPVPGSVPAINQKEGTLTESGLAAVKDLEKTQLRIIDNAKKVLEIGGTLDEKTIAIIEGMQSGTATNLVLTARVNKQVDEINKQIEELTIGQSQYIGKDEKKRKEMIADIEKLKKLRQEILHPGSTKEGDLNLFQDPKKGREKKNTEMQDALKLEKERHEAARLAARTEYENSKKSFEDAKKLYDLDDVEAMKHMRNQLAIIDHFGKVSKESQDELNARRLSAQNDKAKEHADTKKLMDKEIEELRRFNADRLREIEEANRKIIQIERETKKKLDEIKRSSEKDKRDVARSKSFNPIMAFFGADDGDLQEYLDTVATMNSKIKAEEDNLNSSKSEFSDARYREFSLKNKYDSLMSVPDTERSDSEKEIIKKTEQEYKKAISERESAENKVLNDGLALQSSKAEKEIFVNEKIKDAKVKIAQQSFVALEKIANSQMELNKKRIQKQMDDVRGLAAFEMQLAGNNAAAKTRIARREQAEMLNLKRKQAQTEKAQATFSATVSMAQGIATALGSAPPPFNIILASITGAASLKAIADIQSTPLPSYAKGRKGGLDEIARINERGAEIIESRSGEMKIFGGGKETIAPLKAGDIVHTHEESLKILNKNSFLKSLVYGNQILQNNQKLEKERMYDALASKMLSKSDYQDAFEKAIIRTQKTETLALPAKDVQDKHIRQQLRNGL